MLNLADIRYEESYMRTPLPDLKWKWQEDSVREERPEMDEFAISDVVLESIEVPDEEITMRQGNDVWGDGQCEWIGYQEELDRNGIGKKKRGFHDDDDDEEYGHERKPKTRKTTTS
jgi:hypothetical protein